MRGHAYIPTGAQLRARLRFLGLVGFCAAAPSLILAQARVRQRRIKLVGFRAAAPGLILAQARIRQRFLGPVGLCAAAPGLVLAQARVRQRRRGRRARGRKVPRRHRGRAGHILAQRGQRGLPAQRLQLGPREALRVLQEQNLKGFLLCASAASRHSASSSAPVKRSVSCKSMPEEAQTMVKFRVSGSAPCPVTACQTGLDGIEFRVSGIACAGRILAQRGQRGLAARRLQLGPREALCVLRAHARGSFGFLLVTHHVQAMHADLPSLMHAALSSMPMMNLTS